MTASKAVLWIAGVAAGLVLGWFVDEPVFHSMWAFGKEHDDGLSEWLKLSWLLGFLPFWLIVALGIGYSGRGEYGVRLKREAWALVAAVAGSGLAANVLKILLRRERPRRHDGAYGFRAYTDDFFSDSGLALPSGHTTLAFAAAWTLSRICPRARVLWYTLAVACALNRMVEGRHFLSDVWVGAFVGCLGASIAWNRIVTRPETTAP